MKREKLLNFINTMQLLILIILVMLLGNLSLLTMSQNVMISTISMLTALILAGIGAWRANDLKKEILEQLSAGEKDSDETD